MKKTYISPSVKLCGTVESAIMATSNFGVNGLDNTKSGSDALGTGNSMDDQDKPWYRQ